MPLKTQKTESSLKRTLKQIRANILYGLVLLLPIGASVFVISKLFQWFDSWIYFITPDTLHNKVFPGMGILLLLAGTYTLGLIARNYLGKRLLKLGNGLLEKIPLFNKIYGILRQITDTFAGQTNNKLDKVVLIKFPNDSMYSLAFITSRTNTAIEQATGKKLISVFVPNAPNPATGFLLYMPEDDIIPTDISMENAFKLIMSAGAVSTDTIKSLSTPLQIKDFPSLFKFFRPPNKQDDKVN